MKSRLYIYWLHVLEGIALAGIAISVLSIAVLGWGPHQTYGLVVDVCSSLGMAYLWSDSELGVWRS